MKLTQTASLFAALALSFLLAASASEAQIAPAAATGTAPQAFQLSGDFRGTHDPSIAKDGDTYYVFATGAAYPPRQPGDHTPRPEDAMANGRAAPVMGQFPVRCSKDLHDWKFCGKVFPDIPAWIRALSPKTKELWAPDVSYFDGLYHLYYAFSVFGKNTSGIALATNKTLNPASPDYEWVDRGLVLKSAEQDDFNAIDPNLVLDAKGNAWLSFGSFWSGIKMRRIDRATGKLSMVDMKTYSLATRSKPEDAAPAPPGLPPNWEAVEAPFVIRHGDFYYLFVSWDLCCRGAKSTYRTMVGRSAKVTGPYLDKQGKSMEDGGGSALLSGNTTWAGPGGESLLHLADGDIIVFHAYDARTGRPALQISTLGWRNGWPSAALQGDPK